MADAVKDLRAQEDALVHPPRPPMADGQSFAVYIDAFEYVKTSRLRCARAVARQRSSRCGR